MCSIHQPSPSLFYAFDDLYLLDQGKLIYHGETKNVSKLSELY